ncbi:hypothetical protein CSAL01_08607 [Colletotrichum salicis]|uniref:Uncharacterized protein n=1 Tax=Colletotrichum salicis TaxID=1209931 RepID=A0A135TBT2_9PEZI|nr:hypothetical protein CSAL01_08607 [Colletotrichum salicis]
MTEADERMAQEALEKGDLLVGRTRREQTVRKGESSRQSAIAEASQPKRTTEVQATDPRVKRKTLTPEEEDQVEEEVKEELLMVINEGMGDTPELAEKCLSKALGDAMIRRSNKVGKRTLPEIIRELLVKYRNAPKGNSHSNQDILWCLSESLGVPWKNVDKARNDMINLGNHLVDNMKGRKSVVEFINDMVHESQNRGPRTSPKEPAELPALREPINPPQPKASEPEDETETSPKRGRGKTAANPAKPPTLQYQEEINFKDGLEGEEPASSDIQRRSNKRTDRHKTPSPPEISPPDGDGNVEMQGPRATKSPIAPTSRIGNSEHPTQPLRPTNFPDDQDMESPDRSPPRQTRRVEKPQLSKLDEMDIVELQKLQAQVANKLHDLNPERFHSSKDGVYNTHGNTGGASYASNYRSPHPDTPRSVHSSKAKMGTRTQIQGYKGSLKPIGAGYTFSDALEVQQNSKRWACFMEDFTHLGPNVNVGSETSVSKETWFTFTDCRYRCKGSTWGVFSDLWDRSGQSDPRQPRPKRVREKLQHVGIRLRDRAPNWQLDEAHIETPVLPRGLSRSPPVGPRSRTSMRYRGDSQPHRSRHPPQQAHSQHDFDATDLSEYDDEEEEEDEEEYPSSRKSSRRGTSVRFEEEVLSGSNRRHSASRRSTAPGNRSASFTPATSHSRGTTGGSTPRYATESSRGYSSTPGTEYSRASTEERRQK